MKQNEMEKTQSSTQQPSKPSPQQPHHQPIQFNQMFPQASQQSNSPVSFILPIFFF